MHRLYVYEPWSYTIYFVITDSRYQVKKQNMISKPVLHIYRAKYFSFRIWSCDNLLSVYPTLTNDY